MTVSAYTTADLLADIKQEGMIPTSQSTYENSSILNLATRQLRSKVVPYLSAVREGYMIWPGTIDLTSGTTKYNIPSRSVVMSLDDVLVLDTSGDERSIPYIDPSSRDKYNSRNTGAFRSNLAFYLEWNKIVLTQDPGSQYTSLSTPYMIRPGKLVETTDAGKITSFDSGTGVVTLDNVPSDFTTSLSYDIVGGSGGFEYVALDLAASAVDTSTITLASIPTDLEVGDWVCVAGETAVPQIPEDLAPILVYETLVKILKSLGDWDGARAAMEELKELKESLLKVLEPRIKGESIIACLYSSRS